MNTQATQQHCPDGIDPDEFYDRVSKQAYAKAEARNIATGHALEDWLEAEREVTRQCHYRVHPAE